jgi:hypothetical protein
MLRPTFKTAILRMNPGTVTLLDEFAHMRLSWSSISDKAEKSATISNGCRLLHLFALGDPPLLTVISQALGQLTSEGLASDLVFYTHRDECASVQ